MKINGKISKNSRFLEGVLLVILCFTPILAYTSYLYFTEVQSNKNLESKYQDINSQFLSLQLNLSRLEARYQALNTQYGTLLANESLIHNDLSIKYNALQTKFANTDANNTLLQTLYQNLLNNYTSFLERYQTLSHAVDFNYLVFDQGNGTYLAENGSTMSIDYSGTNGTSVIQKCINSLSVSGGKIVLAGKIDIDTPLIIKGANTNGLLQLSGFGPSSQLVVGNNSDGIHIFGDQAFGYGGPYHIVINDLVLTSESAPNGKFMNVGIHIMNWFNVNLENVMVFYANSSGVLVEDSANVNLNKVYVEGCGGLEYGGNVPLGGVGMYLKGSKDCFLQQCYSDTNSIGFLIESNKQTNNTAESIFLNQCEATLNEQKGVILSNCEGVSINSCLIEGTSSDGIMIIDSSNINIMSTLINGNAGNGIVLTPESSSMIESQITIQSCTIASNHQNGIGIWAKNAKQITQVNILSCIIINSGTGARGHADEIRCWDGINISNDPATEGKCSNIKIMACFIGNKANLAQTQKFGIRSLENADCIQLIQNTFFWNTDGNFTLAGTHNTVMGNIDS